MANGLHQPRYGNDTLTVCRWTEVIDVAPIAWPMHVCWMFMLLTCGQTILVFSGREIWYSRDTILGFLL